MTTNEQLLDMAREADEQLRTMCHVLINTRSTPAPLVYDLMSPFAGTGSKLEQLCGHLSHGLANSLEEYEVYDKNRDPEESVRMAVHQLAIAAGAARTFWEAMNKIQSALNLQGHHGKKPPAEVSSWAGPEGGDFLTPDEPVSFGEVLDDLPKNGDPE